MSLRSSGLRLLGDNWRWSWQNIFLGNNWHNDYKFLVGLKLGAMVTTQ
jgi:hypothetical protein